MKKVEIRYFALLKEERGVASESVVTAAVTLGDLYNELKCRHGLSLPEESMAVAVNDEFACFADPVSDSDVIVFIPPVAGG